MVGNEKHQNESKRERRRNRRHERGNDEGQRCDTEKCEEFQMNDVHIFIDEGSRISETESLCTRCYRFVDILSTHPLDLKHFFSVMVMSLNFIFMINH